MFGFGKKKKKHKDSMPLESILALNYKRIQYASMRDPDTYKEIRLGTDGALNIIGDKMHIVCSGESVFACTLDELSAGELMSHDGIVLKGYDHVSGEERTVTAFYLKKD